MVTTAQRLTTAEEFWQMPGSDKNRELIRGEVIKTTPTGAEHGEIAAALSTMLRLWAKHGQGGYVGVEAGYILHRNPDVVRGADVSYVRPERIPPEGRSKAFWSIPPDLAVEVISPSETISEVRDKIRDYLTAGTPWSGPSTPKSAR
jgi:Uma2 family endonuclease